MCKNQTDNFLEDTFERLLGIYNISVSDNCTGKDRLYLKYFKSDFISEILILATICVYRWKQIQNIRQISAAFVM